ncbi:MAG: hypothetical protein KAU28_09840 [Phycisphaerae bacterium]|nr:hypothetical protein [Phycisphaerae bacterium]
MNESTKEALGFLCRWCLLALTGGIVTVVAWTSLHGTAAVGSDIEAELVLPDVIRYLGARGKYGLTGYLTISPNHEKMPVAIYAPDEGGQRLLVVSRTMIYTRVKADRPGRVEVPILGIAYGPLAFKRCSAILQVISRERDVFLVDVRLAIDARAKGMAGFEDCLVELQSRGEVALFHSQPIEDYGRLKNHARRLGFEMPVLCVSEPNRPHDPLRTLWRTASALRRYGKDRQKPIVITGHAELAVLAARYPFKTHLIAPAKTQVSAHDMLRRHDSFVKFKEYLAARPIAK